MHDENEDSLTIFNRKEKSDQWIERKRGPVPLIGTKTRDLLQDVACARDNCNNGLQRKEMICMISEFSGVSLKTAENHYDHLIRSKQLRKLKHDGRIVTAQPTTTNHTAITTEKLLRTHRQ